MDCASAPRLDAQRRPGHRCERSQSRQSATGHRFGRRQPRFERLRTARWLNRISRHSGAAIDTTKSFTVSAWVYINSLANYQTFVTQQGSQSGGFHLEFQNNGASGNVWSFGRATTDAANAGFVRANSSAGSPKTDTWTHLIASWDAATGAMTLYVNGQVVGTATDTTPIASTGPLVIGRGFYNGAANNYVGGGIADVRAYQQSFSAGLANELYQKTGFTPPTSLTFPLSTPTALTSSDGAPVACNTDPAHPAVSTTLTPSLGATLANAAWRADFEMRDVTDPSAATPLYYRGRTPPPPQEQRSAWPHRS
ncbi:LamG domain-containing protein [Catenulispora yoronensis]